MRPKITIPIPPHLFRYLQHEFHFTGNQLHLNTNQPLGAWLAGHIQETNQPPKKNKPTNTYITISIPERDEIGNKYDGRTKFLTITPQNINRFNRLIEYMMQKTIFNRLDILREYHLDHRRGGRMKNEIEKFILKYSIPQAELTIQRYKKAYYRYRKRHSHMAIQLT